MPFSFTDDATWADTTKVKTVKYVYFNKIESLAALELHEWLLEKSKDRAFQSLCTWMLQPDNNPPSLSYCEWVTLELAADESIKGPKMTAMVRALTKGTRAYNLRFISEVEKQLRLPLLPVRLSHPQSPIRPGFEEKVSDWSRTRSALSHFCRSIDIQQLSTEEQLGLLMLSAVVHSALLHPASLAGLRDAVTHKLTCIDHSAPTELLIDDPVARIHRYALHYLNPLTEALLCKCAELCIKKPNCFNKINTWDAICSAKERLGLRSSDKSQRHWIDRMADAWHLKLPAALIHYQSLRHESHSLQIADLTSQTTTAVENMGSLANPHGLNSKQKLRFDEWRPVLTRQFKRFVEPTQPIKTLQMKEKILDLFEPGTINQWVMEWFFAKVAEMSDGRDSWRARKTGQKRRNLRRLIDKTNRISRVLSPYADVSAPSEAHELPSIFQLVMSKPASRRNRINTAALLHQWHEFLVHTGRANRIEGPDPLSARNDPRAVDVNWIHISEFELMKTELSEPTETRLSLLEVHPALPDVALMVAIFGYRCGMRRSEAMFMERQDIIGAIPDLQALVRPGERTLKTISSHRAAPINVLLSPDELALLNRIHRASSGTFLFGVSKRGRVRNIEQLPDRVVGDAIHTALRAATGDQRLRYHHLRHSCASNLSLALEYADKPAIADYLSHMPQTMHWLEHNAHRFKREFVGYSEQPSRVLFYAVANAVGHSGPAVTLQHYIHSLPYMLAHRIDDFDVEAVANLMGKTSESLRYHIRSAPRSKIGAQIRKSILSKSKQLIVAHHYRGTEHQTNDFNRRDRQWSDKGSINAIAAILRLAWFDQKSPADIEKATGIDYPTVNRWVGNSETLAGLTAKNRNYPGFLMMNHPGTGQRMPVPVAPHSETDRNYAKELFNKLSAVSDCLTEKVVVTAITDAIGHPRFSLLFRDRNAARTVIDLFDQAKIPRSHLALKIVHGKVEMGWMLRANEYWRTGLPENVRFREPYQLSETERIYVDYGALSVSIGPTAARRAGAEAGERSPGAAYALTLFLIAGMGQCSDFSDGESKQR